MAKPPVIQNLDWLDVDMKEYRETEVLPRNNFDAKSDLAYLWSSHDQGKNRLIPGIDPQNKIPKARVNTPEVIDQMSKVVKNRMMIGWDASRITDMIKNTVPSDQLRPVIAALKSITAEYGLLGKVYVDARDWVRCANGEGKDIVKQASDTKFVLSHESKCGSCSMNQSGRCAVFQKQIVYDVPYTQGLADEYASKNKVASVQMDDPRESVREVMFEAKRKKEISGYLPSVFPIDSNAVRDVKATTTHFIPPDVDFKKHAEVSLYRSLARKMMINKGQLSSDFSQKMASVTSEAYETLSSEQGLLGPVYVRPDMYDTCHQASTVFKDKNVQASYILEIPNVCKGCTFNKQAKCSLMNKEIMSSIPYTAKVLEASLDRKLGSNQIDQTDKDRYMKRAQSEPIKDLMAELTNYKSAKVASIYDVKENYVALSTEVDKRVAVSTEMPTKYSKLMRDVYSYIHKGVQGAQLKDELVAKYGKDLITSAQQYIRPVVKMAGLLGPVVIDPRGFDSVKTAQTYLRSKGYRPTYLLKEGSYQSYEQALSGIKTVTSSEVLGQDIDVEAHLSRVSIDPIIATDIRSKIGSVSSMELVQKIYSATPYVDTSYKGPVIKHVRIAQDKVAVASDPGRAFRTKVARVLNTGLQGERLKRWIKNSCSSEDISSNQSYLQDAIVDQGIIGSLYIDPAPYNSCTDGAKHVASTPYLKEMGKCAGCLYRTATDRCQVYKRQVVSSIPYDKIKPITVKANAPIEMSPIQEYGLDSEMVVDIGMVPAPYDNSSITFESIMDDV